MRGQPRIKEPTGLSCDEEFAKTLRSKMTQVPWLDKLWHKNSYLAMWKRQTGSPILKVVADRINERQQKIKYDMKAEKDEQINNRDFLSRFLEIQSTNPSVPSWCEQFPLSSHHCWFTHPHGVS